MRYMFSNKEFKSLFLITVVSASAASFIIGFFNKTAALIFAVFALVLGGTFLYFTYKRISEIAKLNDYLSDVFSGNYDLKIGDNTEGEISILENNIFKMVSILKSKNEDLENEKTYLASSLADISHQLKTPLTSMTVMMDLLKESDEPETQKRFADIIENQLEKMRWLISTLLKSSRLDADAVEFKSEMFSSRKVIESSIRPFLILLDLKNIEVVNNVEDFQIKGDETWSTEAFGNIIKNCTEHTDKGGKIEISSKRCNIYDSITISDNGVGIEKEDIDHIFERFYHGKNSAPDSVGIGLSLAKTIFEKEQARITVQSEVGEGTRFEIRFYKAII